MDEPVMTRLMERGDAAAVAELTQQLGYSRSPAEVRLWIEDVAADGGHVGFVVVLRGEVVGWIEASTQRHIQSAAYVLIGGLVVREGMRGLGIGRLLCQCVEAWAAEKGLDFVRVTSRSTRRRRTGFICAMGMRW